MVGAADKAEAFRRAHAPDAPGLVLGNVSTPGLARALERQGYAAVGTTSGGLAQDLGLRDGESDIDVLLDNAVGIARAVAVPVTADLENGKTQDLEALSQVYRRAAQGGLAGASLEDSVFTDGPLFPLDVACRRLETAIAAARRVNARFVMTARTETFLSPRPDLDEAIARLRAYEAVGADVLFAPGLPLEALDQVLSAVSRPVNVLMNLSDAHRFGEIFKRGVRRISLGGGLIRAGRSAALTAAAQALEAAR